ncbi:MAG: TrmH family RNA methyltransferase [Patescibacteria group bacterium]
MVSKNLYLILHNIRSLYNVGSMFRTADAAGVSKIFLTGYTGAPQDKLGNARKGIHKVALGAENAVPWEGRIDLPRLIEKLRKEKIFILALEQVPKAFNYEKVDAYFRKRKIVKKFSSIALLVGNEVRGISPRILKKCNAITEIPMRGKKESLNVSVAAGIALFKLREI